MKSEARFIYQGTLNEAYLYNIDEAYIFNCEYNK